MRKKIRRNKIIGIIYLLTGMFFLWYHLSQLEKLSNLEQEHAQVLEKLNELKSEEKDLHIEVKQLNDEEYIAEIARRDFFLSKPNEVIFYIT